MSIDSSRAVYFAECITAAELCKALVFNGLQSSTHGISAVALAGWTQREFTEFAEMASRQPNFGSV